MQTYVKNCWYNNILAIVIMQQCTIDVALRELDELMNLKSL